MVCGCCVGVSGVYCDAVKEWRRVVQLAKKATVCNFYTEHIEVLACLEVVPFGTLDMK